jgi:hypothetical protein
VWEPGFLKHDSVERGRRGLTRIGKEEMSPVPAVEEGGRPYTHFIICSTAFFFSSSRLQHYHVSTQPSINIVLIPLSQRHGRTDKSNVVERRRNVTIVRNCAGHLSRSYISLVPSSLSAEDPIVEESLP